MLIYWLMKFRLSLIFMILFNHSILINSFLVVQILFHNNVYFWNHIFFFIILMWFQLVLRFFRILYFLFLSNNLLFCLILLGPHFLRFILVFYFCLILIYQVSFQGKLNQMFDWIIFHLNNMMSYPF